MNRDLDTRYVEVTWDTFMEEFMSGVRSLKPAELKKIGSLSGSDKITPEVEMYPVLVSVLYQHRTACMIAIYTLR